MRLEACLRQRNCPTCGSADDSRVAYPSRIDEHKLDDFAFASRKLPEFMHLRLLRCPACGLIYASPALTQDFLSEAYRDASYDSREEADYAARSYARILNSLLPSMPDREMALEVGAGNGAFLRYLREAGFRKVMGIEPSGRAASTAEEANRKMIQVGMFQASEFEPASVNLFCCFQTLEHVEDPRSLCSDAYNLLRPNGAIFLVTHDYDSWLTRLIGERSPIFDIEHLQLFSRQSLRYLLEWCGFRGVRMGTVWNSYSLAYWIKLLPILPAGPKRKIIPLLRSLLVGRIPISANVGNIYAIGFKHSSQRNP